MSVYHCSRRLKTAAGLGHDHRLPTRYCGLHDRLQLAILDAFSLALLSCRARERERENRHGRVISLRLGKSESANFTNVHVKDTDRQKTVICQACETEDIAADDNDDDNNNNNNKSGQTFLQKAASQGENFSRETM